LDIFICQYGCGRKAIIQNKSGNWMCDTHASKCPENKKKNSNGGKKSYSSDERVDAKTRYNNLPNDTKDKMAWARGLTKDTSETVARHAKYLSTLKKGKPGKPHTEKSKRKMSHKRIEYLENNSKQCGWYTVGGIKVQGTLEKDFAEFLVKNDIKFCRKRIEYQNHRTYTPDFYLSDFDLFIEVKGFLYEKDKEKIRLVLDEYEIDLRMVFKEDIKKLNVMDDLLFLPYAVDYIKDIDYSAFKNHWGIEGN